VVEAVEADGEELQLLQEASLHSPMLLEGQLLLKLAAVATQGRRGEAVLGGQGAVRDAVKQAPGDLGPGGVMADVTVRHFKKESYWPSGCHTPCQI
jgi:hypothetical protein